jgi:hypothetical protein
MSIFSHHPNPEVQGKLCMMPTLKKTKFLKNLKGWAIVNNKKRKHEDLEEKENVSFSQVSALRVINLKLCTDASITQKSTPRATQSQSSQPVTQQIYGNMHHDITMWKRTASGNFWQHGTNNHDHDGRWS